MQKIITIDLINLKNENDIFYRFYKSIDCYYSLSKEDCLKRIEENSNTNWNAFIDNISGLPKYEESVTDIVFIIENIDSLKEKLSIDTYQYLLQRLSNLTDPAQRVDGYNFYFQVRDTNYKPEGEHLHQRLHGGFGDGKDMNN